MFMVSEAWKTAYPGAAVGVLAMRNVVNLERHPALDKRKLGGSGGRSDR
jgi:hypothetical protein